jgi:4-amino-4-deoxy-L-arabinose transferase-like glycosyltransferase
MTPPPATSFQRHWMWWFMLLILGIVAAARLRLLAFPLERDEGEYAYAGQLLLQGIPPYELAYNMKFPGTYLAYAAIMSVFGQTPVGIHLGLLLMTTATALMLFWLGKKMLDETAGAVAAGSYVILAASPSMLGLAGHATHFCAFFLTAGLCFMWFARQKETWPRIAAFAFCFGVAVLMKQHAALIAAWAGLAFAFGKFLDRKNCVAKNLLSVVFCAMMMLLPLALCCLWLWHAGVFATFKFWTFDYAREYASAVPLSYAPNTFAQGVHWAMGKVFMFPVLALVGLVLVQRDPRWRGSRAWIFGFCLTSALAVCPDFFFRKHYFLILLPALALLAGAAISGLQKLWTQKCPAIAYVIIVVATVFTLSGVWFIQPLHEVIRGTSDVKHGLYGPDPLPEAEIVAQYIRENSPPDAPMAVLGSEPEIYFLAHRHSASGFIYTYALMESQPFALQMQRQMIGDLEAVKPMFIVFVKNNLSTGIQPDSDPTLFRWWDAYQTNYTRVGVTDIVSATNTIIALGPDYASHYPKTYGSALEIYQRR